MYGHFHVNIIKILRYIKNHDRYDELWYEFYDETNPLDLGDPVDNKPQGPNKTAAKSRWAFPGTVSLPKVGASRPKPRPVLRARSAEGKKVGRSASQGRAWPQMFDCNMY